jgi:predicted dithiol-disulfide oxidoreductase (DUF899 family)
MSISNHPVIDSSPTEEAYMPIAFPNESHEYRKARDALLQQEVELVQQLEAVTAQRQSLPPGGEIPEDYAFDRIGDGAAATVRMSELFGDSDTLMLYNPMFPRMCGDARPIPTRGVFAELPADRAPCPSCTALVDMWDGMVAQLDGLGGKLAIVTKTPIEHAAAFARERGWQHIEVLSAANCTFRSDYGADNAEGTPSPLLTVFKRWPDGTIRLHWAGEHILARFEQGDPSQHPEPHPVAEPLWSLYDVATSPGYAQWRIGHLPANW